jgi:hypothetical protein
VAKSHLRFPRKPLSSRCKVVSTSRSSQSSSSSNDVELSSSQNHLVNPLYFLNMTLSKDAPSSEKKNERDKPTSSLNCRPMPSLAHIIPCPVSDSCDTTVPVSPLRRSVPVINRFCPVLGWRTMLQLLARRAAESKAFSVPDRNALCRRTEDDLLVKVVPKHSTSDVLFPDWSEVVSELPGRSKQQCKERYRLADTVVELTFVFLRVTFRDSLSCRPSVRHVDCVKTAGTCTPGGV